MRLHTQLTGPDVGNALLRAKKAGRVTEDVQFTVFGTYKSRTHAYAYEIQLGTYDKHSLPEGTVDQHGKKMHVRRFKNSGNSGASSEYGYYENVWAATYDEWGWFIAEIFKADPTARWGPKPKPGRTGYGIYASPDDFHEKTHGNFSEDGL